MTSHPDPAVLPNRMLVGSEWLATGTGGTFDHVNPATGRAQRSVPLGAASEIDRAVGDAQSALEVWSRTSPAVRRKTLHRLAQLVRDRTDELVVITALETGSPIGSAAGKVASAAEWIESAGTWADKLEGTVIPAGDGTHDFVTNEPLGVIGVIVTWNGPLVSFGMSAAAALAAGCTVVLKPSELAPFSSLYLGSLALEAGLPPGALSVVPGRADAGAALVEHPGVAKISFTGGPGAARQIATTCAMQLKPMVLELGGKSASIVFDDADLGVLVRALTDRVALSAGQSCICPTRLVVDRRVHDQAMERLLESFAAVRPGDPFDPLTTMGPVINADACDRILRTIERSAANGEGKLLIGGSRLNGPLADGFFIEPTIFGNVDPTSSLAREEIFGPVLSVFSFDDEDEAVHLANDTPYGLAGYVYTSDISRALRVGMRLQVGNVGINGGRAPMGPQGAFGGVKASGYGREGGRWGLLEFCYQRTTSVQILSRG